MSGREKVAFSSFLGRGVTSRTSIIKITSGAKELEWKFLLLLFLFLFLLLFYSYSSYYSTTTSSSSSSSSSSSFSKFSIPPRLLELLVILLLFFLSLSLTHLIILGREHVPASLFDLLMKLEAEEKKRRIESFSYKVLFTLLYLQ